MTKENPIEDLKVRAQLTADELKEAIVELTKEGSTERAHAEKLAKAVVDELVATIALFKKYQDEGSKMSVPEAISCQAKAMVRKAQFDSYMDKLAQNAAGTVDHISFEVQFSDTEDTP